MYEFLKAVTGEDGELSVNLSKLIDLISSFCLYLTVALIVASATALLICRKNERRFSACKKTAVGIAIGYAVSVAGVLGYLKTIYAYLDGKIDYKFWLMAGLFVGVLALSAAGLIIRAKCSRKAFRWYFAAAVSVVVIYLIVLLCVVPPAKDKYAPLSDLGMYGFSCALIAVAAVLTVVFGKSKNYDSAKSVSYAAVCVSLSFALSYVKFFSLPQGGSVTFASLLPLMLYSYMFGARKGVLAGVIYGLLQFIQSPQFYQPMQVLLDYPIAFGVIGLAGIAHEFKFLKGNMIAEFMTGASVACLLRYVAHVLSGYYVFGSWAMEGYSPLGWSFVYNLYVIADLAIVLVAAAAVLSARTARRQIRNVMNYSSVGVDNTNFKTV